MGGVAAIVSYVFIQATSQFSSSALTLMNQRYIKKDGSYDVLSSTSLGGSWANYLAI